MMTLLSERSRVFEAADPQAVSAYVNQYVGSHQLRGAQRSRPQASIDHRAFASLDLCRIGYGGAVRVTSPALGTDFHVQILLRGHCLSQVQGQEHRYVPGELPLINPDDPGDLTYSVDCEKFIVKLPLRLFEQACVQQRGSVPTRGLRFAQARHALVTLDDLLALIALICREAEAPEPCPVAPLYERILASKLLSLMTLDDSPRVSRQALDFERLLHYIDEHLQEDLGIRELTALMHVSERKLYLLFERGLGLAPMDYVRQRRLERIRQLLQTAEATSVTAVALDYGFLNLGRFAQAYRARFGELPSQTWRRHQDAPPLPRRPAGND